MTPKQLNESLRGQLFSDVLPDWFIQRFNGSEDENYGIILDVQPMHKSPYDIECWQNILEANDTMDCFYDMIDDGGKYLIGHEHLVTVLYNGLHSFRYISMVWEYGGQLVHRFLQISDNNQWNSESYPGYWSFYAHVPKQLNQSNP